MYVPRAFEVDPAMVDELIARVGSADLVTVGPDGTPHSSLLPIVWDRSEGLVVAHFARANPHWRLIRPASRALAIVHAPQTYVSPSWYASKAVHGRVVPTWNYTNVHLTGEVTIHDDPEWVRQVVTRLTDLHESPRADRWAVTDAPPRFLEGQLRGIVGVELRVDQVEAKAKLSQNRSEADRLGVVRGLDAEPAGESAEVASAMRETLRDSAL